MRRTYDGFGTLAPGSGTAESVASEAGALERASARTGGSRWDPVSQSPAQPGDLRCVPGGEQP